MRPIKGNLSEEIIRSQTGDNLLKEDAYPVARYRDLVVHMAKLAYINMDHLLFFRGQSMDYRNKAGASTFYPSIYRGARVTEAEVKHRFEILEGACQLLVNEFERRNLPGAKELKNKKYIQWSILQHYEVCSTPLIDFTHSIRVGCSFATLGNKTGEAYIFVFGLPYLTNRISMNSEQYLVNIRLLSICPPNALRPYFQDAYLAGTEDILDDYDDKPDLDFNRRLIAKFKFSNSNDFWGKHFPPIPKEALFPRNDEVEDICIIVKKETDRGFYSGNAGDFLYDWSDLEESILSITSGLREKPSVKDGIRALQDIGKIGSDIAFEFDDLMQFRNKLVHRPKDVNSDQIEKYQNRISKILTYLK
jgi:hypothetical protein